MLKPRNFRIPFRRSLELWISLALGLIAALLFQFGWFTELEHRSLDWRFIWRGERPASRDVVLVAITDTSINKLGSWPWPREIHNRLLAALKAAGAKVIAFDILFNEPSLKGETDDQLFAEAIASSGNVILPVVRNEKTALDPESCEMVTRVVADGALPVLRKSARDEGFIDLEFTRMNRDGVIRNLFLEREISNRTYGILGMVVARHLIGKPIDVTGIPLYTRCEQFLAPPVTSYILNYAGKINHFEEVSYEDVLDGRFQQGLFKDRAVIVGTRAKGTSEDVKFTPYGAFAGMEIHAHLVENLVQRQFLRRFPPLLFAFVLIGLAFLLGLFLHRYTGWIANLAVFLAAPLGWPLLALAAFHANLVIETIPVIALIPVQGALLRLVQQFLDLQERNRELAKRVRELSIINEVSQAVNFMGDLHKILDTILSRAVGALGADRGSILLLDDRYESLVEESVVVGVDGPVTINPDLKASFKIGEGVAGEVFQKGTTRLITDLRREKDFKNPADVAAPSPQSLICVPLQVKESPIGVMNIVNKVGGEFDHEDLQLALTMANQAAVVIEKARLFNLATIDGLTQLVVHRHFQAKLEEEVRRARRYDKPLTLIMTDIDHFKKFNDTYGHQIGDLVLREVAKCVRVSVRDTDIAARYGGEEFAVILPETDVDGGKLFAERLRQKVEASVFSSTKGDLKVTISLGVSSIPTNPPETGLEMVKLADEALYEAKHSGRNRVCVSSVKPGDPRPEMDPVEGH